MEDRLYVNPVESKANHPLAIGCVFDGHNGDYAAELLRSKFATTFCHVLRNFENTNDLSAVIFFLIKNFSLLKIRILR
jgi:serine/threonine protein phosphatase PrpC